MNFMQKPTVSSISQKVNHPFGGIPEYSNTYTYVCNAGRMKISEKEELLNIAGKELHIFPKFPSFSIMFLVSKKRSRYS